MSDDQEYLKQLLKIHQDRLQVLEMREAQLGLNTPPEIIVEMRHIRQKIGSVNQQISSLTKPPDEILADKNIVEIILYESFEKWSSETQTDVLISLSAIIEAPLKDINILKVYGKSVNLLVDMPSDKANLLLSVFQAHEIPLKLGIESVRIINVICKKVYDESVRIKMVKDLKGEIKIIEKRMRQGTAINYVLGISLFVFGINILISDSNTPKLLLVFIGVVFLFIIIRHSIKSFNAKNRKKNNKVVELLICYDEQWNEVE